MLHVLTWLVCVSVAGQTAKHRINVKRFLQLLMCVWGGGGGGVRGCVCVRVYVCVRACMRACVCVHV